jgi:hypothetical protein
VQGLLVTRSPRRQALPNDPRCPTRMAGGIDVPAPGDTLSPAPAPRSQNHHEASQICPNRHKQTVKTHPLASEYF